MSIEIVRAATWTDAGGTQGGTFSLLGSGQFQPTSNTESTRTGTTFSNSKPWLDAYVKVDWDTYSVICGKDIPQTSFTNSDLRIEYSTDGTNYIVLQNLSVKDGATQYSNAKGTWTSASLGILSSLTNLKFRVRGLRGNPIGGGAPGESYLNITDFRIEGTFVEHASVSTFYR
jgi:hypothetical protein